MTSTLSCLMLCSLFGQLYGLRLNSAPVSDIEYNGYNEQIGWEYPKTAFNPPWTPEIVERLMVAYQEDSDNMKAAATGKACRVVMVGDSITELFVRGSFNSGMPDPDKLLLRDDVQIFAAGGDRFRDMGWRLFDKQHGGIEQIRNCNPEDVFVLLGTNDYANIPGESSSIRDMHHLVSQLRQALPSSTRLTFHAVPPRCCNNKPQNAFSLWRDNFNRELQEAVNSVTQKEGGGATVYADCSDVLLDTDGEHQLDSKKLYADGVHLNTDGLEALGRCVQNRYNLQVMRNDPKMNPERLSRIHHQGSTFVSTMPLKKTVLFVGDSVDRNNVDYFCEAYRHMGAELHFAQEPETYFGRWSAMGKVDKRLASALESSHIPSWKSWMVHVCTVPALEVTVASIFNAKGVSPNPPWWAQEKLETLFNMEFCGEADHSCHNLSEFLRPPLQAIPRLYSNPSWQHSVVINSNFWDLDREFKAAGNTWSGTEEYVEKQWKREAGNLIASVKKVIPSESTLFWHTSSLPEKNTRSNLGFGEAVPKGQFGGVDAVKAVNKAARAVAKDKGVNIIDWELVQAADGEGLHPSAAVMMPEVEEVLKFA